MPPNALAIIQKRLQMEEKPTSITTSLPLQKGKHVLSDHQDLQIRCTNAPVPGCQVQELALKHSDHGLEPQHLRATCLAHFLHPLHCTIDEALHGWSRHKDLWEHRPVFSDPLIQ